MKSSFTYLAGLFLYGLTGVSAHAALVSYEATNAQFYYSFNIQGITATPGGRFSNAASSSTISATLDTTANTFSIDHVKVDFGNVGLSFTQTTIIGFGQSVPLQFDFQARPFSFEVTGGDPVHLTPDGNGNYTGGSFAYVDSRSYDPIIIDYKITNLLNGDVTTGTASPEVFSQESIYGNLSVNAPLKTTGVPGQMTLSSLTVNPGGPSPGTETITAPISGGSVAFNFSFGFFNVSTSSSNPIVFNQVPEPASGALFGLAAATVAFKRRRRAH